jgi:hypothetical protein
MYTLLLLFVLSAGMALGETAKQDCQSYYEINGVRTCLSSNDAPQKVPDVIGRENPSGGAGPDIGFRETHDEHETCACDECGTPEAADF